MAYTKNSQKTNETKVEKTVEDTTETVTISKEEFDQMKAQMEAMMKMMAMGGANATTQSKKPEKYITFVNMTKGRFVLKGSSFYTIGHQFESRKFLEREAKLIVNNMPNSVREGAVYILDADFIQECELEDIYRNLLTDKDMIELLNHEPSYVIEVYKNASDGQKKIIVDMIENKKINNEFVDANILLQIGKLCGKDLINIESMEDMKEG